MPQSNLFLQGEIDTIVTQIVTSGVNTVTALPNDDIANALVTIGLQHAEIHEGKGYNAAAYEKLNAGSALTMFITAPTTAIEAHVVLSVETDGPGLWTFSKLTDASGGTNITPVNHYLQSANAASTETTYNALVTSTGTILDRGVIGAAGKFSLVGGDDGGREEWRLSDAEEVILVFTADGASTRTVLRASWYEE